MNLDTESILSDTGHPSPLLFLDHGLDAQPAIAFVSLGRLSGLYIHFNDFSSLAPPLPTTIVAPA
jgi:hypothetical protein